MLAVPEVGTIQCSYHIAAPEVINHYLEPSQQAVEKGQIDFFAQDMWSLGCLLVWLVVGDDPFIVTHEELALENENVWEVVHMKHNLWVSWMPNSRRLQPACMTHSVHRCILVETRVMLGNCTSQHASR